MTQQIINVGSAANDGTGDPARTAFTKSNDNFTELYSAVAGANQPPQGRLTLQTVTPVMTTSQTAKTTVFYSLYCGSQIVLYDGTNLVPTTFAELSNVTTASSTGNAGPAAVAASSVYDLFVWSNAGTVTLTRGPAWTSDTARSAGTALVMVQGLLLNNAAITNGPAASRGTYVGTVRSNASSQLNWQLPANDTAGALNVWNAYNRVLSGGVVVDTTASWTYNSTTGRQKRASANNSIAFVSGLQEELAFAVVEQFTQNSATTGFQGIVGVGVNSTTVFSGIPGQGSAGANITNKAIGTFTAAPFGYQQWSVLEATTGAENVTFYGTFAGPPARNANGFTFQFPM